VKNAQDMGRTVTIYTKIFHYVALYRGFHNWGLGTTEGA